MQIHILDINYHFGDRTETLHPVIITSEEEMILVDAGYPGSLGMIREAANKQGVDLGRLTTLVLTHHDLDHVGSAAEILGAYTWVKVCTSLGEAPFIKGERKSLRLQQAEELYPSLPDEHKPGALLFMGSLEDLEPVTVDQVFDDNDTLLGGALVVISTPGHTPGHFSVYFPGKQVLVAGDALVIDKGSLDIANPQYTLDLEAAFASVEKLSRLPIRKIICYHGGVIEKDVDLQLAALLRRKISYLTNFAGRS